MDDDIDDIINELDPLENTSDEINDIINEIVVNENTQIEEKEETPLVVVEKTDDELMNITIDKNDKLEKQLDTVVDLFLDGLARGTDHSHSSKEQLLEALKTKLELNKTFIEMAKLKNKKNTGGQVGIMINTIPQAQSGISIENIRNAMDEE